jgi:glycosyltransferase involved in cell wall biosynthesis
MLQNLFLFSELELILAGSAIILFIIQILYLLITYARPLRVAKKVTCKESMTTPNEQKPVSVIVYARGDADDLRNNLPAILTQDYPEFEVIVVNDGSDADSEDVLKLFSNDYKHLYYTYVPVNTQYLSHKKLALTMGIKAAKHETLLFTEINCRPFSSKWISTMTACYTPETSIRLGFCAYPYKDGFRHNLIAYDNLLSGLQYLSSALGKHPYSGNGRNLSYRRELFFAQKGYSKSLNLHAGADDLFINDVATAANTLVELRPDSIMEMEKIEDYSIWREMKISQAVTQQYFKGHRNAFFRFETCSLFLFQLIALTSIVVGIPGNWLIAVLGGILFISRYIIKATILRKSALLLRQQLQSFRLPILELLLPLYNLYFISCRTFKDKNIYTSKI